MAHIAIIKTGATGDVVRTSVLFHLFPNDTITWITARPNIVVLPQKRDQLRVIAIDDCPQHPYCSEHYDLVISLDDDRKCAALAGSLPHDRIFGAYIENDKVVYSDDAREWFDMGLSSRLGKTEADRIKWLNQDSYQEILFRMLGKTFRGEEYLIREDVTPQAQPRTIGIEARAGNRWPTKIWNRYPELGRKLEEQGYKVVFFEERAEMADYFRDIAQVSMFIGGDSLGMHIALALKIPLVTVFSCTSATEIYGYGRMQKLVSPYLQQAFYRTDYIPEAVESITMDMMLEAVERCAAQAKQ